MKLKAKVSVPEGFLQDVDRVTRVCENLLDMIAEDVRIDFQVTTQTWDQPVDFKIEKSRLKRVIYTTNPIYKFVTHGTAVRYATMTPDFRAKTVPGQIRSRKGKGGVAYISRKHPRPGIVARRFDDVITEKWIRILPLRLQVEIMAEMNRAKTTAH